VPESIPFQARANQAGWEWPQESNAQRALAYGILDLVLARRRLSEPNSCAPGCEACYAPHLHKTLAFIRRGRPVELILPGFPAKSPNAQKVLGHLPDTAEVVALTFLHNLCVRLQSVYPPGAKLIICSDGRVFSDLVQVHDDRVTEYREGIRAIIQRLGNNLDTYNLEDEFGPIAFEHMRRELVYSFGQSLDEIHARVVAGGSALVMFNGQARFLFEDMTGMHPSMSRSQARKITKERAYSMILRSEAWGTLVARRFPDALRLSIHPQPRHGTKIGIHLLQTYDNWLTPWHATAVRASGRFFLLKRYHAERMGAEVVFDGGRPVHFTADSIDLGRIQRAVM
jgi:pyoverdine/dityrosine biosynthesis protein Dit1